MDWTKQTEQTSFPWNKGTFLDPQRNEATKRTGKYKDVPLIVAPGQEDEYLEVKARLDAEAEKEKKAEPKMIRLDEKQYRAVKKMTRAACANNDCGNCLLLDDGETCVCVQSISYSLLCRYFREAVLPADRQLCEQITRSGETDLKRCAVCGSTFAAGSNRAKYCPDCAAKIRRRQKAQSERNRRLRIKTTT